MSGTHPPPTRGGFAAFEHTADEGVRAWGADLDALFAQAARALFATIVDLRTVRPRRERRLEIEAESREALLHDWLEELNTLHQSEGEVYREFAVRVEERPGPGDVQRLAATVRGEPIDPARHDLRTEVKAVTLHELRIERTPEGYQARILFDV